MANAQNQLNQAQANLNNAQSQLNNLNGQFQQHQSRVEEIRRNIEWQVRREQEGLAGRMNEWANFLRQAQSNLSSAQNRYDNINRYELPRAQQALRDYESRRPGAVNEVYSAEQSLANSTAAYNSYKASVDYDNIKAESDRTAGVVSQIQATISQLQYGVSSRQELIRQQTALRDSLIKRLADTMNTIAQKEARLTQVDAALAAYDVQKAEIMGRLNAASAELRAISDQYAGVLLN